MNVGDLVDALAMKRLLSNSKSCLSAIVLYHPKLYPQCNVCLCNVICAALWLYDVMYKNVSGLNLQL